MLTATNWWPHRASNITIVSLTRAVFLQITAFSLSASIVTMTAEDIESDNEDVVSITRTKAMKKKNYQQASSAIKEMK